MPSTPMLNYLDWPLAPEQQMIQGVVREFVEQEALPTIPECFEKGEFPRQLIPRLGELGVLGPTIPKYGSGLDYTSYGLICQELERGDSGLRSFASVKGNLADVALVWAKVSDDDGTDTVRGFLVETDPRGFTANEVEHKLSLRASV